MRSISALAVTLAVCALSAERGAAFAPASPSGAAAATRRATSPFTRENVVVFKRKGKSGVPSSMREQYEAAEQAKNQQQIDESKPVFYVFARKPQGVWYPATVFQGDDQATNLIKVSRKHSRASRARARGGALRRRAVPSSITLPPSQPPIARCSPVSRRGARRRAGESCGFRVIAAHRRRLAHTACAALTPPPPSISPSPGAGKANERAIILYP